MSDDGEADPSLEEEEQLSEPSSPSEEVAPTPMPAGTPSREPGQGGYGIPPLWT